MVREPYSRVVSHFQQPGVKPAGFTREEYPGLSVAQKLAAKPEMSNNYMTRMLLGKNAYYSKLGALSWDDLTTARKTLAAFEVCILPHHSCTSVSLQLHKHDLYKHHGYNLHKLHCKPCSSLKITGPRNSQSITTAQLHNGIIAQP